MQQHAEVLTYALSKMDRQLSQLAKKVVKLKSEIEEAERLAHLELFCGSIGSAPLRLYVERHLKEEADLLVKKRAALEEAQREHDELRQLKDSNPALSAAAAPAPRRRK